MSFFPLIPEWDDRVKTVLTPDICRFRLFKGYLRYKMITSHNVPSDAQVNNFLLHRKIMFRFQDSQVFEYLTIP